MPNPYSEFDPQQSLHPYDRLQALCLTIRDHQHDDTLLTPVEKLQRGEAQAILARLALDEENEGLLPEHDLPLRTDPWKVIFELTRHRIPYVLVKDRGVIADPRRVKRFEQQVATGDLVPVDSRVVSNVTAPEDRPRGYKRALELAIEVRYEGVVEIRQRWSATSLLQDPFVVSLSDQVCRIGDGSTTETKFTALLSRAEEFVRDELPGKGSNGSL